MPVSDIIQIIVFIVVLICVTPILGSYMAKIFNGEKTIVSPCFHWLERLIYARCGINTAEEMNWRAYTKALIFFNVMGFVAVFCIQLLQHKLPFNPAHLDDVQWPLAFNTAVSFMTNTNWQAYAGETTLSYCTQMIGLTVQNFLSAATGIAVFCALTRGLIRKSTAFIGNFWVDVVRSVVYILLPLSIIFAVFLVGQGVVQTFKPYQTVTTLEGQQQTIPLGPAASQIAIKQLGTNGGGFFNTNSAHPFENPTPLSNFFQMLAIFLVPAGLVYTYGLMIKSKRHAWIIFAVMLSLWLAGLVISLYAEYSAAHIAHTAEYLEGKETRFGIVNSVLWSTVTTAASNGSVNALHSSLSPLAGGVALFNMMVGEIIFGGVGAGMYGMIIFIILTVFLAGLMVGRTPEYLGKKIGKQEIQMVIAAILLPSAVILLGTGIACIFPSALASLSAKGPHGFSEMLYAFSSAAGNNGSAFAGLNANTLFYNLATGVGMIIGRFGVIIPCLVIAGSFAGKNTLAPSSGTFKTDGAMFAVLLVGVITIVGVLTFFPALMLGPIVEHLVMCKGMIF